MKLQPNRKRPARADSDRSSLKTDILATPATVVDIAPLTCPGLAPITAEDARRAARQGYCPMAPVFRPGCDDAFIEEVDRLIALGLIPPSRERVVAGEPTEWVVNLGLVWGQGPDGAVLAQSPGLRRLYRALQAWAASWNAQRPMLIAAGLIDADEAPEIAPQGIEMNVNRVVGSDRALWSGLHLHRDMHRFTDGLRALDESSVRHAAIRARGLTVSAYFRPLDAAGRRLSDTGGALVFMVRDGARNPGDRGVFDVVLAEHNTGAWFFPHTVHGVARMAPGSVRYSFQAFFPRRDAWERDIQPRIARGELARELAEAARRGRIGWR